MKVLCVCLGNICRSPTAEGVLRALAAREFPGLVLQVDSAGTAGYHVGEPPDRRTIAVGRRRGYELSGLRARQVTPDDFHRFDYILAMDRNNLSELKARRLAGATAQLALFMSFADVGHDEVPDPYYGSVEDFERVLDLCEHAARGFLRSLQGLGTGK
jgi:protein-tyrosine phosphatase